MGLASNKILHMETSRYIMVNISFNTCQCCNKVFTCTAAVDFLQQGPLPQSLLCPQTIGNNITI